MNLAVLGIDHRHAFGMLGGMQAAGATAKGLWTDGEPNTLDGFTKRFPEVPRVAVAERLVAEGAIGKVVQTAGLGPHRRNRATRPDWFFDRAAYGGIPPLPRQRRVL